MINNDESEMVARRKRKLEKERIIEKKGLFLGEDYVAYNEIHWWKQKSLSEET